MESLQSFNHETQKKDTCWKEARVEKINYWLVQKDVEDNFIIYPIPMFPIKGYIVPDEEAAIKFTNRMYPIIGLGFGGSLISIFARLPKISFRYFGGNP